MAAFSALTAEQQAIYTTFEKDLRAVVGLLQRFLNTAASLKSRYDGQMAAILVALDNNAIVPNSSGLAGTSALDSDAEMVILYNDLTAMLTTYNTAAKQQLRAKAAGQAVNGTV